MSLEDLSGCSDSDCFPSKCVHELCFREDENDLSDEDADMVMSSSGGHLRSAKEKEAENRRRNREFFVRDELIGTTYLHLLYSVLMEVGMVQGKF